MYKTVAIRIFNNAHLSDFLDVTKKKYRGQKKKVKKYGPRSQTDRGRRVDKNDEQYNYYRFLKN